MRRAKRGLLTLFWISKGLILTFSGLALISCFSGPRKASEQSTPSEGSDLSDDPSDDTPGDPGPDAATLDPPTAYSENIEINFEALPACEKPADWPGGFALPDLPTGIDFQHEVCPRTNGSGYPMDADIHRSVAAGLAAEDFNGDGVVDLFFAQGAGENRLYWGQGDGSFLPATDSGLEGEEDTCAVSASAADFDADGHVDLLLAGDSLLRLHLNNGDGSFHDASEEWGLQVPQGLSGGTAVGDIEGDGDLDLFVCGYTEALSTSPELSPTPLPNAIYRNTGEAFADESQLIAPINGKEGICLHPVLKDLDTDGDLDLIALNDFGYYKESEIWSFQGASSEDPWQLHTVSVDGSGLNGLRAPMGASVLDLTGDGLPELWISDMPFFHILESYSPFSWVDVRLTWGEEVPDNRWDISWSVLNLDLAGWGNPAFFVGYGPVPETHLESTDEEDYRAEQEDRLLVPSSRELASRSWVQHPSAFPNPLLGNSRGAATADFNHDGVPDLVVSNIEAEPTFLLGQCTEAMRLHLTLRDETQPNWQALGAKVRVTTSTGTKSYDVPTGGPGTWSTSPPTRLIGTGDDPVIERIEVEWPGGGTSFVEGLCSHCSVTITRSN